MSVEIERKYLLPRFPEKEMETGLIKFLSRKSFEQTYLALSDDQEVRVRKIVAEENGQVSKKFVHTFKQGQGLVRKEIEYEIAEDIYEQLVSNKKPLKKLRTQVIFEDVQMEIDEYMDFDLMTVEVEFDSEEQANAFKPPYWFGEEVGSEKEYRNKTLWKSVQDQK